MNEQETIGRLYMQLQQVETARQRGHQVLRLLKSGELQLSQLTIDELTWTLEDLADSPAAGEPGSPENPLEPTSVRQLSDEELATKRQAAAI